MRLKIKKVYYCDFCKKHSLAKNALEKHEKHCTLNPNRECRLCGKNKVNMKAIIELQKGFQEFLSHKSEKTESIPLEYCSEWGKTIKRIAEQQECPICALAVLRQSNTEWYAWVNGWSFKKAIEDYWEEKNEEFEY